MDIDDALTALQQVIDDFRFAASSLVADIALIGLGIDVLEAGQAVRTLAGSQLPHRAYPCGRQAFEAAQQAIVLATHEHYVEPGARAWVYFERKDSKWRASMAKITPHQWLERRVEEMAAIWDSISPGCGTTLRHALQTRKQTVRPDNWLGEVMTARQHAGLAKIATALGNTLTGDSAATNAQLYAALCRETHARPRLEVAAVHHSADGSLRIDSVPRDLAKASACVLLSASLSAQEAMLALAWRVADAA